MPSGGARNRSGPAPDPNSQTSERKGLTYRLLPREGFAGKPPRFPLPAATARERLVWRNLWKTPQAAMWNIEPWRHYTVAQYCRWSVRAEDPDAPAAVLGGVMRLSDQIGLSPAGLRENGWRLATDEVRERREIPVVEEPAPAAPTPAPVRRLRAAASE